MGEFLKTIDLCTLNWEGCMDTSTKPLPREKNNTFRQMTDGQYGNQLEENEQERVVPTFEFVKVA